MTAYLSSYLPALQSILPRSSPTPAQLPSIGSPAPTPLNGIPLPTGTGHPTLIAFVRHAGCPFAAKELILLAQQLAQYPDLHVVIVQHSAAEETDAWFTRIGAAEKFTSFEGRYTLVSDPERVKYAEWGIGTVGWLGMINAEVLSKVKMLDRDEGIKLTETGKGSWRWQNSGGFAIDEQGIVRWTKIAKDAGDVCDYAEAARVVAGEEKTQSRL